MRYLALFIAVLLDGLQILLGLGFAAMQFITPVGGGVGGALAGAGYCWSTSTGFFIGLLEGAKCALYGGALGGVLSTFAIPIGAAVDVALSLTIGGGIILLLAFDGAFYPSTVIKGFLAEAAPFLNILPVWTGMVWRCIQRKKQDEVAASVPVSKSFVKAKGEGPWGLKHNAQILAQRRQKLMGMHDIKPAQKAAVVGCLLLVVGLLAAPAAYAQALPAPIQYVVYPEVPGPNQTVNIEAQGVGSFLGDADITWTHDGKTVQSGVGVRTYTFTTGALGQKTTIGISIDSSQGLFSKTFSFTPSLINLVWEADTTIPPFYLGKALYSAGSSYKVVAFPTVYSGSSRISPNALSYQWSHAGDSVPDQSGLGRYVFTGQGDQLQAGEDVSVDVYYGASKVGTAAVSIPVSDPKIVLYERDALRGAIYDAAMPQAISLQANEITLQAEPYYFSVAAKNAGTLSYAWTLNGEDMSGPDTARGILTLRQSGSGAGSAAIGVTMQNTNPDQFVQTATAALQIVFGASTGQSLLNFFGL